MEIGRSVCRFVATHCPGWCLPHMYASERTPVWPSPIFTHGDQKIRDCQIIQDTYKTLVNIYTHNLTNSLSFLPPHPLVHHQTTHN
jgi:hypothetical protein